MSDRRSPSARTWVAGAALATLSLLACSKGCGETAFVGKASGRVESTGTTGPWVIDHGECFAGDREGFFGVTVDAPAPSDASLMFVKDPLAGWVVKATVAGSCHDKTCTYTVFTKDECKTLSVDLHLDPSRKKQLFDGSARFDCEVDGAHVFGNLEMHACR